MILFGVMSVISSEFAIYSFDCKGLSFTKAASKSASVNAMVLKDQIPGLRKNITDYILGNKDPLICHASKFRNIIYTVIVFPGLLA